MLTTNCLRSSSIENRFLFIHLTEFILRKQVPFQTRPSRLNYWIVSIMSFNGFLRTVVTLLVLNTARLTAAMYQSMTEYENLKMKYGEFVFSTLSSERQEALFEDFQVAFSREVKLYTNLTEIRDNWSMYLCFPEHVSTVEYATLKAKYASFEVISNQR